MRARVTHYKVRPDAIPAARAEIETMKDEIMALHGIRQFLSVINDAGDGYVVSLLDAGEAPKEDAERIRALWGRMAPHLEATPAPAEYDVVAWWENE
jgi:hypothetical protein